MLKEIIIWTPIVISALFMTLMCIYRTSNKLVNIFGAAIFGIVSVILCAYNLYISYNNVWMYWLTHFACVALFPTVNLYITVFTVKSVPKRKWVYFAYIGLLVPVLLTMHWFLDGLSWTIDTMTLWIVAAVFTVDSYKLLYFFRARVQEHFSGKELKTEERLFTHMFLLMVMSGIALLFFSLVHLNIHEISNKSLALYMLATIMIASVGHFVLSHHINFDMYHNVVYKESLKVEHEGEEGQFEKNRYKLTHIKEENEKKKDFVQTSFVKVQPDEKKDKLVEYSAKAVKQELHRSYTTFINGYRVDYTLAAMTEKQMEDTVEYIAQKTWSGCKARQENRYKDFQWISPGTIAEDLRKKVYTQTTNKLVPIFKRFK